MTRFALLASFVLIGTSSSLSAQELKERVRFKGHSFHVSRTALSPDGKILASGGGNTLGGELKLWDAVTGEEIAALAGYSNSLYSLAFSPDGKLLASAGALVQVWDVKAGKLVFSGGANFDGWIQTVAFSSDSKRVAAAGWTDAHVWDVASGYKVASLKRRHWNHRNKAFSKDLANLALPDYQEIDLREMTTGKINLTLSEHRGEVGIVNYSNDGMTLIAASTWNVGESEKWYGDLKLWDVATGKERIPIKLTFGRITEAALSPDGAHVALLDIPSLHSAPDLKLLDLASSNQTTITCVRGHEFLSVAFTKDNRLYAVGTPDEKELKLWEVSLPKGKRR